MPGFPYRITSPVVVGAVIDAVRADPAFVACCLVVGDAHGFHMEIEYMQRADHTTRYQVWSDVQGELSTEERTVALDFAAELARVRAAGIADTVLPAVAGSGRNAFIVLATRDSGVWVDAPTPAHAKPAGDGPLDAIFNLVFPS